MKKSFRKPMLCAFLTGLAAVCAVLLCRPERYPEIPAAGEAQRLAIAGESAVCISVQHVTVPQPDAAYARYAELQALQHLPLAAHIGEAAEVYTYETAGSPFRTELLCANGVLIGAQRYLPEDPVPLPLSEQLAP